MGGHSPRARTRALIVAACIPVVLGSAACAGLGYRDRVEVGIAGLEPIPGQGLEMRFDLKLRIQNPNEVPIEYDGIALALELNGKPFATGVSGQKGSVPRFGETVVSVPISVSAVAAVRQALRLVESGRLDDLPYELRGKFGGGSFARRFTDRGTLSLPGAE